MKNSYFGFLKKLAPLNSSSYMLENFLSSMVFVFCHFQPTSPAKFCDECGSPYLRPTSKFCSECGTKRFGIWVAPTKLCTSWIFDYYLVMFILYDWIQVIPFISTRIMALFLGFSLFICGRISPCNYSKSPNPLYYYCLYNK